MSSIDLTGGGGYAGRKSKKAPRTIIVIVVLDRTASKGLSDCSQLFRIENHLLTSVHWGK